MPAVMTSGEHGSITLEGQVQLSAVVIRLEVRMLRTLSMAGWLLTLRYIIFVVQRLRDYMYVLLTNA